MTTECAPDLDRMADAYRAFRETCARRIVICAGTGCVANGSLKVHERLVRILEERGLPVAVRFSEEESVAGEGKQHVSRSGCQGFCQMGPLVRIEPDELLYVRVKPDDVEELVEETLVNGRIIERLLYVDPRRGVRCRNDEEMPFYARQKRLVMKHSSIEPECVEEYVSLGGYGGARKAYLEMTSHEICQTVIRSGLRGRGGGGFPTGKKWFLTLESESEKKYVICNGDEGDPGAFMDRSVMEGNPHSVIEGMMIAARAVGADEGYVYVRAEYPLAVRRLRYAVAEAEKKKLLGDNLFGSGYAFRIHVMEGAGAFVCGEETALIASIEGNRGMPMPKPPFPAQRGLWGKPTVINNVETLATVPHVVRNGPERFREMGTAESPGTKTFALTGHVANTGLIEVPFGTTLREIVHEIGGGVTNAKGRIGNEPFKAVQIGGPSGGCLTEEMADLPLDFESLKRVGAMIGSGGLVVMNRQTCMVSVARFFMQFTQNESCGKCVPCREGTKQMLVLLDDIIEGRADEKTLPLLEQTARAVKLGSLCGLGKTAPNPVLSTLAGFRDEYLAHIRERRCPAGQCKALTVPEILADRCKGCTLCRKKCPTGAIRGEPKSLHVIDPTLCVRCGVCRDVCRFDAVVGV